jgi:hypothetical protein
LSLSRWPGSALQSRARKRQLRYDTRDRKWGPGTASQWLAWPCHAQQDAARPPAVRFHAARSAVIDQWLAAWSWVPCSAYFWFLFFLSSFFFGPFPGLWSSWSITSVCYCSRVHPSTRGGDQSASAFLGVWASPMVGESDGPTEKKRWLNLFLPKSHPKCRKESSERGAASTVSSIARYTYMRAYSGPVSMNGTCMGIQSTQVSLVQLRACIRGRGHGRRRSRRRRLARLVAISFEICRYMFGGCPSWEIWSGCPRPMDAFAPLLPLSLLLSCSSLLFSLSSQCLTWNCL